MKAKFPKEFPLMDLTFVSYDGKYPNLCSGELVLAINGEKFSFGSHCLVSGGSAILSEDGSDIEHSPWTVAKWPEGFPDVLKPKAVELVNANVPWGCCGGCL